MARWAAILAALTLLLAGAGYIYFVTYEPSRSRYPVRGVDVSHHQGAIDWAKVAADDVAFAYIKATEGGDFRDSRFVSNWTEAQSAGLAVGAYHFFTFCRPATDQARNIIEVVPKAPDALPIAIDLEFGGNCSQAPSMEHLQSEIAILLRQVEAHFGKRAILYVTKEFHTVYGERLPDRRLWFRSIAFPPRLSRSWAIWQYHNRGSVDGVAGPVDLNVLAAPSVADFRK
jgi:lysozyme